MKVRETEDGYIVEFFPQAKVVDVKEEPERGWKVEIGYLEDEDVFVPARVFYDKRFTLEEVLKYARRLEECKICNSLNMNVTNVEEIVADDKLKDYVKKAKEMRAAARAAGATRGNGEKKEEEGRKLTEKLGKIALTKFYSPAELLLMGYLADDDELIEIAMNSVKDVDDLFKSPRSENKNKKKKKKKVGRGAEIFKTVLLMNDGGDGNA